MNADGQRYLTLFAFVIWIMVFIIGTMEDIDAFIIVGSGLFIGIMFADLIRIAFQDHGSK